MRCVAFLLDFTNAFSSFAQARAAVFINVMSFAVLIDARSSQNMQRGGVDRGSG